MRSANRAARSHGGKEMRIVQHQKKYGSMEKNCMYQLVVVQDGQYGCVHKDSERMVLDHPFKTYEEALFAASRRYRMLKACPDRWDTLVGAPGDFTVTVKNTDRADFSDHYFIEEV